MNNKFPRFSVMIVTVMACGFAPVPNHGCNSESGSEQYYYVPGGYQQGGNTNPMGLDNEFHYNPNPFGMNMEFQVPGGNASSSKNPSQRLLPGSYKARGYMEDSLLDWDMKFVVSPDGWTYLWWNIDGDQIPVAQMQVDLSTPYLFTATDGIIPDGVTYKSKSSKDGALIYTIEKNNHIIYLYDRKGALSPNGKHSSADANEMSLVKIMLVR